MITIAQPTISAEGAARVRDAAVAHAAGLGVDVSVSIVDPGGHLTAFARMDGAPMASISVAHDKAFCAVSASTPTKAWNQVAADDPEFGAGLSTLPRFTLLHGGVPIVVDDVTVGAVGISGGSNDQDEAIAQAAVASIVPAG